MSDIKLTLTETVEEFSGKFEGTELKLFEDLLPDLEKAEHLAFEKFEAQSVSERMVGISSSTPSILRYGERAQKKLQNFTGDTLKSVASREVDEINNLLLDMSSSIKILDDVNAKPPKFFAAKKLKDQYTETSGVAERVRKELNGWLMRLQVDLKTLDEAYRQALECYGELSVYISNGKQVLKATRTNELESLQTRADTTRRPEDAFACRDLRDKCETLERRLHDLEITKIACLQTALQIQMLRQTDQSLVLTIRNSINKIIPIWQQSITAAMTERRNKEASKVDNTKLLESIKEILALQKQMDEGRVKLKIANIDQQTVKDFKN